MQQYTQEYRLKTKYTDQFPFPACTLPCSPTPSQTVVLEDRIFTLENFLSPQECGWYINALEELDLKAVSENQLKYRSNVRCRVFAPELCQVVFKRLLPFLKPIRLLPDDYKQTGRGYKLGGLWVPCGIDEDWVVSKYPVNSHFGPHFDGPSVTNFNERTLQTIVIYLNEGFEGGATNFLDEQNQALDPIGNEMFYGKPENVLFKVIPKMGSALVFNHHQLHEGELLTGKPKYIMRSDITYKRVEMEDMEPKEIEGINWLLRARQAEVDKNIEEATGFYRRAYKAWPDLEFLDGEW